MFSNVNAVQINKEKMLVESVCLSTDSKPTSGVANGSTCIEMDTGKIFMFNEAGSTWVEVS